MKQALGLLYIIIGSSQEHQAQHKISFRFGIDLFISAQPEASVSFKVALEVAGLDFPVFYKPLFNPGDLVVCFFLPHNGRSRALRRRRSQRLDNASSSACRSSIVRSVPGICRRVKDMVCPLLKSSRLPRLSVVKGSFAFTSRCAPSRGEYSL